MSTDIKDTEIYQQLLAEMENAVKSKMDREQDLRTVRLCVDNADSRALVLYNLGYKGKNLSAAIRRSNFYG